MLPLQKLRLPQGGARVNWNNARARGLCFFAPLRDGYGTADLVGNAPFTNTGMGARIQTQAGNGFSYGASSYTDFVKPTEIGGSTPFTVAWSQEARSGSSYSTILNCNFGSGTNCFIIYQESGASGYGFTAGPRAGGFTAQSWTTALGAVVNNRLDRFVLRCAGGSQSTTGADYTLYRNGQLITRGTATSYSLYTSAAARIGARETGGDPWEGTILDMRMWARVLTDDEAARESELRNVGELYEPRRIWIPVSVAGSGSAITQADGVATASTLAGTSTAASTPTAAAGAATASSIAGASTAAAAFVQADGVATASTLTGSSGSSAITQADGTATASTMAGSSVAAAAITQADGVGSGATMQGSDAAAPVVVTTRRVAGGRAVRKRYLIKGKFYWLTDDELSVLIAQELADIGRRDVKVAALKAKPRVISAQAWAAVKPLARLEALAERMEEDDSDDEDELILMMV